MVEVDFIVTFPYKLRVWPPKELAKRNVMESWLDANVRWDRKLEIKQASPKHEAREGVAALHYTFRVHSLEDVALVKMRC